MRRFFLGTEHGSTEIPCNAARTLPVRVAFEEAVDAMIELILHSFSFLRRRRRTTALLLTGARGAQGHEVLL